MFKGITPEQKQHILNVQNEQRKANIEAIVEKQMKEERWAVQDLANRRTVNLLDRASARASKERAITLRKENEVKALQDKQR
jgi:RIB43A